VNEAPASRRGAPHWGCAEEPHTSTDSIGRYVCACVTLDPDTSQPGVSGMRLVDVRYSGLYQACASGSGSATPPHLLHNLPHWCEHFVESVNHRCRLKCSSKCSHQWGEIVQQMGRSGTRLVCISLVRKITRRISHIQAYAVRLVNVRYSGLYQACAPRLVCISLARKITRCISHLSTDAVRLVDVRYSVLYFFGQKITTCIDGLRLYLSFFCSSRVETSRCKKPTDLESVAAATSHDGVGSLG